MLIAVVALVVILFATGIISFWSAFRFYNQVDTLCEGIRSEPIRV